MDFQQIKNIYHLIKAILANIRYGFPSKSIQVIGVTGTDGKTTTSALIYHILKKSSRKVSLISTVSATIGKQSYDTGFHTTTPSPFTVQGFIRQAVDDGDEYFVLETTSHALDQFRVFGVSYRVGLITNITHEHLHYHKTYERYVKAKARLLQWSRTAIINRDDKSYPLLKKLVDKSSFNKQVYTYSLIQNADFRFDISRHIGKKLAHFNKYNYLGAYAVCKQLGLTDKEIYSGMKTYELPPGRLEMIYDEDFKVIIDFAHTPNGLHEALHAIKDDYVGRGRLIHVFGAAAFRDDTKRPIMGRESATFADTTILTEEDYRTEDPYHISKQIAEGMTPLRWVEVKPEEYVGKPKTYTAIINRQEAIAKAVAIAKKGDVIVLTGKGHEQSLCRGTKEYPWDDKKAALESLQALRKNHSS
jgi:UDP-N-acetylmuramoyl-L-alanyl-D-glutamate--2,6-diaminopimelate ligase